PSPRLRPAPMNRSAPHDPRRLRKARGGDDLCRSRPAINAFRTPRTAIALSAGPDTKWRNPISPGPHPAPNAAPHMRGRFARYRWAASVEPGNLCSRTGQWNRPLSARSTRHPSAPRSGGALSTTRASQRPTCRSTNRSSWWGERMRQPTALVACEFSGRVRDALTRAGFYAVSCDLLPSETEGEHIQGDVLDVLDWGWDLLIAHPPCTDLATSGARWFPEKIADG